MPSIMCFLLRSSTSPVSIIHSFIHHFAYPPAGLAPLCSHIITVYYTPCVRRMAMSPFHPFTLITTPPSLAEWNV